MSKVKSLLVKAEKEYLELGRRIDNLKAELNKLETCPFVEGDIVKNRCSKGFYLVLYDQSVKKLRACFKSTLSFPFPRTRLRWSFCSLTTENFEPTGRTILDDL